MARDLAIVALRLYDEYYAMPADRGRFGPRREAFRAFLDAKVAALAEVGDAASPAPTPLADQIAAAGSHASRATILLRMPDACLAAHHVDLSRICDEAGFDAGLAYLAAWVRCFHATRDGDGNLPAEAVELMDAQRDALRWAGAQRGPS